MGKEILSIGLKTLKTSYPTKTEKEFDFLHPFSVTWDENTGFFPHNYLNIIIASLSLLGY